MLAQSSRSGRRLETQDERCVFISVTGTSPLCPSKARDSNYTNGAVHVACNVLRRLLAEMQRNGGNWNFRTV